MTSTRDFQEYASSGEIIDIKIGGTSLSNKVLTFGDIPTDYLTDTVLNSKFIAGDYEAIYLDGSGPLDMVATKKYVLDQLILNGGYSDAQLKSYLSGSNDLSAIYIGTNTFENKVAVMSDLSNIFDYSDSDVVDLLESGSISAIYVSGTTEKLKVATEVYMDNSIANLAIKSVNSKYVSDATYVAITADRGKTIYMTSTAAKSVSVSTSVFALDVQMAVANLSSTTIKFFTPGSATINGSTSDLLDAVPAYGIAYVTRCSTGFLVG